MFCARILIFLDNNIFFLSFFDVGVCFFCLPASLSSMSCVNVGRLDSEVPVGVSKFLFSRFLSVWDFFIDCFYFPALNCFINFLPLFVFS